MSGGSMNYIYQKLQDEAFFRCDTPERMAFAEHIKKVAKALHDIEWVDSCDYAKGDEVSAIRACINDAAILSAAVSKAESAKADLERLIELAGVKS